MKWAGLLSGVALALGSSRAAAQTPAQREEARQHFERAVALVQQSRWQDAIVELSAARDLAPTPAVYFNLGFAQRAVGRNREAIESFRRFLAAAGAPLDPERRRQVEDYIRELSAAMGRVELRVEPADATVTVDGEAVVAGVTSVPLDPGRHVVTAEAPGYQPGSRVVELGSGQEAVAELRLSPVALRGHLRVESTVATATIEIDGRDRGTGTADADVPPGLHRVVVRAGGYQTYQDQVTVIAGGTLRVRAALAATGSGSLVASPWFWLGATALVTGGVVGGVLLFSGSEEPVRPPWGIVPIGIRLE